jgi:hypothetical protein
LVSYPAPEVRRIRREHRVEDTSMLNGISEIRSKEVAVDVPSHYFQQRVGGYRKRKRGRLR